jgi:hypothetical protein
MSQTPFYAAWVVLSPAADVPGAWMAHALEFDVVTQGDNAEDAYRMAADAVEIVLVDDLRRGADPFARRAPAECWWPLVEVWEHGERLGRPEFMDRLRHPQGVGAFAVQMVFWPEGPGQQPGRRTPPKPYEAALGLTSPTSAQAC